MASDKYHKRGGGNGHRWTVEELDWMSEHVPGSMRPACMDEFAQAFGWKPTIPQWNGICMKHGFKHGTNGGWVKPGHVCTHKGMHWDEYMSPEAQERCSRNFLHPRQPVGHIYHSKLTDYIKLSDEEYARWIADGGTGSSMRKFVIMSRYIWWKNTGEMLDPDMKVVHKDCDTLNNDFSNLDVMPSAVYHRAQNRGWTPDTYEQVKALAMLDASIVELGNYCPCCGKHFEITRYKHQVYCADCIDSGAYRADVGRKIAKTRYERKSNADR